MEITHPIAEKYGKHLLPRNGWATERLAGLLNVAKTGLDSYAAAVKRAGQVSDDLKDHARAKKQHEILSEARQAYAERIDAAFLQIQDGLVSAQSNLRQKTAPKNPENSTEKLHDLLIAQEIRAELKALDSEKRLSILQASVRNGDRTLLDAVKGPVRPLVQPETIHALEESYARSVAGPELDQLDIEKNLIDQAQSVLKNCKRQLSSIEKSEPGILPKPPIDLNMTTAEKSKFVSQHGPEAFGQIVAGEKMPADFETV